MAYGMSGHLPATTSKDSHRKLANVSQNASALKRRCRCKPKTPCRPRHHSSTLSYSITRCDFAHPTKVISVNSIDFPALKLRSTVRDAVEHFIRAIKEMN